MKKIFLTKEEKFVLKHVVKYGKKQPKTITPAMYHYCLSTLQEKKLIEFRSNYEEILSARLTIKGIAYIENNPKLYNPVDWKGVITLVMSIITAIATSVALFIACRI